MFQSEMQMHSLKGAPWVKSDIIMSLPPVGQTKPAAAGVGDGVGDGDGDADGVGDGDAELVPQRA